MSDTENAGNITDELLDNSYRSLAERLDSCIDGVKDLQRENAALMQDRDELAALVKRLREALDPFARVYQINAQLHLPEDTPPIKFMPLGWPELKYYRKANEALALTPPAALQEHDKALLEKVAAWLEKRAQSIRNAYGAQIREMECRDIAAEIRRGEAG